MPSRREFLQASLTAAALPSAAFTQTSAPHNHPIKHIAVLMMENRSFDHMLSFSGIPGTEIPADAADRDHAGEPIHPNNNGVDAGPMGVDPDPDHDFKLRRVGGIGRSAPNQATQDDP